MECVHVAGGEIIKQKTVATEMYDVTSVTSQGTWQECAGQSSPAHQHPQADNVRSKLITLRELQIVTVTIPFSKYTASCQDHLL